MVGVAGGMGPVEASDTLWSIQDDCLRREKRSLAETSLFKSTATSVVDSLARTVGRLSLVKDCYLCPQNDPFSSMESVK